MWVFLERAGDGLYVGEAYDDDGATILERTEPKSARELEGLIVPPGADAYHFDIALYDADERQPADNDSSRAYFLLRIRASTGTATTQDGQWVIGELRNDSSRFSRRSLIYTLGELGPAYEDAVAPFLDHANTDGEAEAAMTALIEMGLADQYADRLIAWMQGGMPLPPLKMRRVFHGSYSARAYGIAVAALRRNGNRRILRAYVNAANDGAETWISRENALRCLALAIDLENAPVGESMSPDHAYMQGVLAKAEAMLAAADARDGGTA
jgi:hypothetical protein